MRKFLDSGPLSAHNSADADVLRPNTPGKHAPPGTRVVFTKLRASLVVLK